MADSFTEGPSFRGDQDVLGKEYQEREDVLETFVDAANTLSDTGLEDIMARALARRTVEDGGDGKAAPVEAAQPVQIHVPDPPRGPKGKKMLPRLPLGEKQLAVASEVSAQETVVEEQPLLSPATPPSDLKDWDEDIQVSDDPAVYPGDTDQGGMYSTQDPVLSTTSVHLAEFREKLEKKMEEMEKRISSVQKSTTAAHTEILDKIRAMERRFAHDPPLSTKTSEAVDSFRDDISSNPASSPSTISFAERMRLRKQGR